jgi:hypothetical protein
LPFYGNLIPIDQPFSIPLQFLLSPVQEHLERASFNIINMVEKHRGKWTYLEGMGKRDWFNY